MMLYLSDFFQPLNFKNLLYFIFTFVLFDATGNFFIKKLLNIKHENKRILYWLVGFGLFVFLWFTLSLVIPPTKSNILISSIVLALVVLPLYIKEGEYKNLFTNLWENRLACLLILPFLPAVFVKSSLPPYYGDEMAYHFVAPSFLKDIQPTHYVGGIYSDLPRILNLFWQIVFTVFNTYSIARLFHFLILSTSLVYAYSVLKRNFGFLTGFLFVLIFFSLPQEIILTSTLGYIDVGAYSFLLIAVVSAIDFAVNHKVDSFIFSAIFWAMNLGTKYTGISAFVSFVVLLSVFLTMNRSLAKLVFTKRVIIQTLILLIIFGGYWYIKNFIMFGNPIFPFLFKCWGVHVETCPTFGGFFGDWTTKINISNIELIVSQLLPKNKLLQALVFVSPLVVVFSKNKSRRNLVMGLFLSVVLELLMLKFFSGFYIRYQQHLQLFLIMSLLIFVTEHKRNLMFSAIIFILITSSSLMYIYNVRYFNSLKFLNWNEISYSIGKINIYEWIRIYLPSMQGVVKWCENPPQGQKDLARFDPDLIWFDYEGYVRSFITNCNYVNPPLQGIELSKVLETAKSNKMQFWINSKNGCIQQDQVGPKHPGERSDMIELRKLNNIIVCNSVKKGDNLYYFDYLSVK